MSILTDRLRAWAQNEEMVDSNYTAHGRDCTDAAIYIEQLERQLEGSSTHSAGERTFVAPRTHDEASERIAACVWEIQVISDAFGYDPFQWLADEETVAPSASVPLKDILALPRIVPSDLSADERWQRNGEYISLQDVQRIVYEFTR